VGRNVDGHVDSGLEALRGGGARPTPVATRLPQTGDALFDLATLTLGNREHLGNVAGYGSDIDRDLIRAWWSMRCLTSVRRLAEHGHSPPEGFAEVAVLRSRL
jgi:hypothetical protein